MAKININNFKNYGSATVGERGQVVIPNEIRKAMKIKSGDKFFVFSRLNKVIVFIKPEHFDTIINEMIKTLKGLKETRNK